MAAAYVSRCGQLSSIILAVLVDREVMDVHNPKCDEGSSPAPREERGMDAFTEQHLMDWISSRIAEDEQVEAFVRIKGFCLEHPEFPGERSWREVLDLATD